MVAELFGRFFRRELKILLIGHISAPETILLKGVLTNGRLSDKSMISLISLLEVSLH
jgi:hypothetical protein